jgi:hypothetical protein
MRNRPEKQLQIALVFAMGTVRGGVIGLTAPLLGLVDSVPIPVRMANSAVAVFYWMQIGSIYFDVIKYSKSEGHTYAKLEPTSFGNMEKL